MICPRCSGQLYRDLRRELTCLACGYVEYPDRTDEEIEALRAEAERRQNAGHRGALAQGQPADA